jgi:AraC-like DNA-binding protein
MRWTGGVDVFGDANDSEHRRSEEGTMSHDILSDVLRTVRLRGALFFYVNGSRSWAAEAPPSRDIAAAVMPDSEHVMEYHVITRGTCWGAIVGEGPVRLETGDIVVFPHGDAHVMSSAPGMRASTDVAIFAEKIDQLPFTLNLNAMEGREETASDEQYETALVCGFLGCDIRPFNPLIATLPRLLHLRRTESQDWILHFIRQAVAESKGKRPGGEAMLERMSEMMFVDAVRRYVDTLPENSRGWLAGLRDRFVGHALALMHDAPATQWTVEELGRRVGLSRSALHERFVEMIGQPPMQYLASWRMQVASALLCNSNATVASVALEVGYDSEAAFTRAFKRLVGRPPAAWRRHKADRMHAAPVR